MARCPLSLKTKCYSFVFFLYFQILILFNTFVKFNLTWHVWLNLIYALFINTNQRTFVNIFSSLTLDFSFLFLRKNILTIVDYRLPNFICTLAFYVDGNTPWKLFWKVPILDRILKWSSTVRTWTWNTTLFRFSSTSQSCILGVLLG
jgi:hypothetical protein